MSNEDFEPAKLISIETTADGTTITTIEVSSFRSFLYYVPHAAGQVTKVRISSSCPPLDRNMIIEVCNLKTSHVYEPSVDDGGQPPRSDDQGRGADDEGESSSSSHQEKEDKKKS